LRTLSRPLLLGLLLVAVVTGSLSAFGTWRAARIEVDELLDAELAQTARSLQVLAAPLLEAAAERSMQALAPPREVPVWEGEMLELGAAPTGADGHAYERQRALLVVRGTQLLLRTVNAPSPAVTLPATGFSEFDFDGQRWRSFRLDTGDGLSYLAMEPLSLRAHIAGQIARGLLWPLLLELPLLALLIWLIVRLGSRSLRRVAQAVSEQAGHRLQPIERSRVPVEIHGLVDAINGLIGRTEETLRRERRFLDEAAHELRTPVAALRLQLSNLREARGDIERARAHQQLDCAQARLERSVAQLLALGRLGPEAPTPQLQRIDLSTQLPVWLAEWIDSAAVAEDEVELLAEPGLGVLADAQQLPQLLRNLVDNALRHGGRPAQLRVELFRHQGRVVLAVDDLGPGLAPAERERVLDPFYRAPGSRAEGSGLGLSIVARIAELCGAGLQLLPGSRGRGLRVEVIFPAA
jgi:two-component system sensor histidine kinase QseC